MMAVRAGPRAPPCPSSVSAMSSPTELLPPRRPDLVIRPLGDDGRHAVKDPLSGEFFQLGPQEHFLLTHLDGRRSAADVCAAFVRQFGEPLSEDELTEFLEVARAQGLLSADGEAAD